MGTNQTSTKAAIKNRMPIRNNGEKWSNPDFARAKPKPQVSGTRRAMRVCLNVNITGFLIGRKIKVVVDDEYEIFVYYAF